MTPRAGKIRRAVAAVCFWLMAAAPLQAHDLGAIAAHLTEDQPARYTLDADIAPALSSILAPPILPERCQTIPAGSTPVRFRFECAGQPLRDSDRLILPWEREGVLLSLRPRGGPVITTYFLASGGVISVDLASLGLGAGSLPDAARRYTVLGIEHILFGVDHLLFVLCLLLIVRGVPALLKTITAFTLGHSVTLALATLGLVHVPSAPVEAAIALSIVLTAAEGLRGAAAVRRPWLMASAFGLLHGFGFAGALASLGLPSPDIPVALLFFNVGVEAGQIAFVATMLLLGRLIAWPQRIRRVPGYAIGAVATVWLIERVVVILHA